MLTAAGGPWAGSCWAGSSPAAQPLPHQKGSAAESKRPASAAPGPLLLDDAPQPLAPQPQTEAQRDHLEALARFAAGAMHERREEYADALRCYQRALRHDPKSAAILWPIVRVAFRLQRKAEAVRYAIKAADLDDADGLLLRRLGAYLTEEGDWARALKFYEKALAARGKGRETAADVLLRMEMGRLYYLADKYKQAADSFARVLYALDHPDEFALDQPLIKVLLSEPGLTYQLMGECFLSANRPQEAMAVFEKVNRAVPNKALWQFNLARVYAKTGKPAEALAALEASFAEHLTDQDSTPYETLADVLASLGKKAELLDRLEKLRAAEPHNMPLGYYLAAQYRAAGKLDKAEALCIELLKGEPKPAGYRSLVEMARQSKRFDALLAFLGEAIERTGVLESLGTEAQTISSDAASMRGVVEAARSQMKSAPEKFGYGKRLAVALLALEAKQYETAGEFFSLALAVASSAPSREGKTPAEPKAASAGAPTSPIGASPSRAAEVLMVWGVGLLMGDRPAEAAKVFQRGIDEKVLPSDNPAFYFYLAGALAMAGRHDEALASARTAAEKKPASARFRARPAWVLYTAKRYGEAATAYRKLIEEFEAGERGPSPPPRDESSEETRDVLREARLALSNLAVIQSDMPQAEEWLEQVLDEFPDDEGALNDLGYLWADQNKNLQRAERMIRKALGAEPDNLAYRDSLGWVLFRLGKYAEAIAELQKAAAGPKPDPTVLDHLGDAYRQAHERDKALASWRKAVEVFRQEKEMKKAAAVEKKITAN
jgi:tetratricopeptide (TPR) repeat protein